MVEMPEFDELYVVSDLHMGGSRGRQIFDQGTLLKAFIDYLTALPARNRVGLVINGKSLLLHKPAAIWFRTEKGEMRGTLKCVVCDKAKGKLRLRMVEGGRN